MFLWILLSLISFLLGMGGVAFVTLLERKLLGLSQIRLGPNKVTISGVLQPMVDGIKLLTKYNLRNKVIQFNLFSLTPITLIVIFLFLWTWVISWEGNILLSKNNSLLFFSVLGVGAYSIIMAGWSSTSVFSKLGSMRGILQSLSYEVALIISFMFFLFLMKSLSMSSNYTSFIELFFLWLILWLILALMESNRAPFDLLEGESELISGFNIEMGSLMFVYLFLSEYGMLIVMMVITNIVIMKSVGILSLMLIMISLLMRSCFPRIRYDSLMGLMWQCILPISVLIVFNLLMSWLFSV